MLQNFKDGWVAGRCRHVHVHNVDLRISAADLCSKVSTYGMSTTTSMPCMNIGHWSNDKGQVCYSALRCTVNIDTDTHTSSDIQCTTCT